MNIKSLIGSFLLVAALGAPTVAEARCALSGMAGKHWEATINNELSTGQKILLLCSFSVSAAGTVPNTPIACDVNYPYPSTDINFKTATAQYAIVAGKVEIASSAKCTFDVDLQINSSQTHYIARVILGPTKTMATGNVIVSLNNSESLGSGTIVMVQR